MLFEIPHYARRSFQTERASSREDDGIHFVHQIRGFQQIRLSRTRRGSPHIHTRNSAALVKNDGAAGGSSGLREVADFNSGNVGNEPLGRGGQSATGALVERPYS